MTSTACGCPRNTSKSSSWSTEPPSLDMLRNSDKKRKSNKPKPSRKRLSVFSSLLMANRHLVSIPPLVKKVQKVPEMMTMNKNKKKLMRAVVRNQHRMNLAIQTAMTQTKSATKKKKKSGKTKIQMMIIDYNFFFK